MTQAMEFDGREVRFGKDLFKFISQTAWLYGF